MLKKMMMEKNLFVKKNVILLFFVLLAFFLITRIPLAPVFDLFFDAETVRQLRYVFVSLVVIILGWFVARKYQYLDEAGFRSANHRNYWMLLIPLVFPGILFLNKMTSGCLSIDDQWIFFTSVVILRAVMEEVLCRGVIQGYMIKNHPATSKFVITIVSAVIFGALHFIGLFRADFFTVFAQVVYATIMGLLFGALMIRVGNVWLLGLTHGIVNVMAHSCSSGTEEGATGTLGEYLLGIGGYILVLSPIFFIYWLLIKTSKKKAF